MFLGGALHIHGITTHRAKKKFWGDLVKYLGISSIEHQHIRLKMSKYFLMWLVHVSLLQVEGILRLSTYIQLISFRFVLPIVAKAAGKLKFGF